MTFFSLDLTFILDSISFRINLILKKIVILFSTLTIKLSIFFIDLFALINFVVKIKVVMKEGTIIFALNEFKLVVVCVTSIPKFLVVSTPVGRYKKPHVY